jgi:hypothetical protein
VRKWYRGRVTRAELQLSILHGRLAGWAAPIRRSVGASSVAVKYAGGKVTIAIEWDEQGTSKAGSYAESWDAARVSEEKRPSCRIARDIITAVHAARGVT